MHFSRSVLYLFLFFLFPFFSCKKVQDVITQTFSPEIKINQEFEFIFKEYAKQRLKEYNIDTTGINIDNLPANVYFALQQFIKLDILNKFIYLFVLCGILFQVYQVVFYHT